MTLATREADAAFADLICGDPQWLRAEFDALISASFSGPPAPPLPAPTRVPPRPGSTPPPSRQRAPGPARHGIPGRHQARTRSAALTSGAFPLAGPGRRSAPDCGRRPARQRSVPGARPASTEGERQAAALCPAEHPYTAGLPSGEPRHVGSVAAVHRRIGRPDIR